MIILPVTRGSPWGLSHSRPCGRGKIPRGDGDENPPATNSGWDGDDAPHPASLCIPVYIEFYLYILITYNMYNINIRVNIVFY